MNKIIRPKWNFMDKTVVKVAAVNSIYEYIYTDFHALIYRANFA